MQIVFETNGTTLVAKLTGELDHHTAAQIREKVDLKLSSGIYQHLIFDFGNVNFMDSSGIGVIMGRVKILSAIGGRVSVANPKKNVEKMLHMGGLEKYITILKSADSYKGGMR